MAALSYYSNWTKPLEQKEQLFPQLSDCMMSDNFVLPDDNLLDPNDLFYFDEYCNSLPSSISPEYNNLNPIPTQPFSYNQEFEQFHYPKRQKPDVDNQEVIRTDALFNSPVPNPCPNFQDFSPLHDFATAPPVYSNGGCEESVKKQQINGGNLSAQSIAARQRRSKITEKTRELGKLIPGAQRMNTAEMFQAAYKYIKYLQTQVGILECMGFHEQEKGKIFESEELLGLVESPLVQEKLYSTEKCVVPKKFLQELSSDDEMFHTKPRVFEEIRDLLPIGER